MPPISWARGSHAVGHVVRRVSALCVLLLLALTAVYAQIPGAVASPQTAAPQESPRDPLGRSTPRGTVMGFLDAARRGENDLASHYLRTSLGADDSAALAHQLFMVLDARLPARLTQVSDTAEGSRANPLTPDEETIGTVAGPDAPIEIVLERIQRSKAEPIWLFSKRTLDSVPELYADVVGRRTVPWLPGFLFEERVSGIRMFDWLAVLLGVPALYLLTVVLNRVLTPIVGWARRRRGASDSRTENALPAPARLLLLAIIGRWVFSVLPLSLLVRQALSNLVGLVVIVSIAWLIVLVNGAVERHLSKRIPAANYAAAVSLLRVGRRLVDILVVLIALLALLRHFGVNPTPILAGLGVGGIAVALAAQKTLENVIAGASLIFDQAVRIGDYLKVGEVEGTVEHIGLRSTRIRTLGRSVVTVPNGQVANMVLETLSERDKFWFHPIVGLRYETTSEQMEAVLDGIRGMLAADAAVERSSIRVRFLRLSPSSKDVEVFAYVFATNWAQFLEIQEKLLLAVTDVVASAGTSIAFPSQTMYVERAGVSLAP